MGSSLLVDLMVVALGFMGLYIYIYGFHVCLFFVVCVVYGGLNDDFWGVIRLS